MKKFRLRNGIVVEQTYRYNFIIVSVPEKVSEKYEKHGYKVGALLTLIDALSEDVLWSGGTHGEEFDVIEEVTE